MTHKSVIVISKKWRGDTPLILNATGHVAQSLAQQASGAGLGIFVDYQTEDDVRFYGISTYPFVLLTGTPAKMWSFKSDCEQQQIITSAFVETMFHGGTEIQLQTTAEKASDEHDLICVGVFGETDVINALTKKFSLFRV
ncbi:DUF2000 family protein [Rhodobacteraceae bacterium S2214]|nr:DUF2000 family protein [Rhodobacteraceae bacterium S2214]